MRSRHVYSPLAAIVLAATLASAQQPAPAQAGDARRASSAPANPHVQLPYGAADSAPVSRWTPPASAGRQLTLNDLLTWKQIRTPILSNDGRWLVYNLAPNEGDAEVVIRSTAADGKEWRHPIGEPPSGGGGGFGGGAGNALGVSGNNRWVAFLIYPSSASSSRGRPGASGSSGSTNQSRTPPKLAVVSLADGSKREFENVRSFSFAGDRSDWLAVHHGAPAPSGGAGSAGGGGGAGAGVERVQPHLSVPAQRSSW